MYRGTTPTLKIKIDGADLSEFANIYITVKQGETVITKATYEITADGDIIYVPLTQEDTLQLSPVGYSYVQMRAIAPNGLAVASNVAMVPIQEILQDGVIE